MEYRVIAWREMSATQQAEATHRARRADEASGRTAVFAKEEDRRRHETGVWLAYEMVSRHDGCEADTLVWRVTDSGKPYFLHTRTEFSVSHAGDFVLCAIHDASVGADIEQPRTVRHSVIQRVCRPEERAYITAQEARQTERFLAVWTAKEALAKCTGQGIRAGLASLAVADERGLYLSVGGYTLYSRAETGYTLSVVYEE